MKVIEGCCGQVGLGTFGLGRRECLWEQASWSKLEEEVRASTGIVELRVGGK